MRIIFKLVSIASILVITGCASSFDVEKSDFGCAGMPVGVKCLSAKDVYAATESSDYVNGDVAQKYMEKKKANKTSTEVVQNGNVSTITPAADKPLPIRHPSRVMRVWINSFEDEDGDLYAGQYVFTEIEPRRWSIGSEKNSQAKSINPLNSDSRNTIRETVSPLSAIHKNQK